MTALSDQVAQNPDGGTIALEMWDKRMRTALRPLLTKKIIGEHRRDPTGHHSDTLNGYANNVSRVTANVLRRFAGDDPPPKT